MIKGVTVHLRDPYLFDFIIHPGDQDLSQEALKAESTKLTKYFMAALTIPADEMWVNLSPYEKDRIIPAGFGDTEMGRDLLAQDYLLKQLTASLMHPEDQLGHDFWRRVYDRAYRQYGTTDLPMNTFNKVWIIPDRATIFENEKSAFIMQMHLKVLLEEDYLALESNRDNVKHGLGQVRKEDLKELSALSKEIIRDIIIPEIEREVNQGQTFAALRQISAAVILATWYKQNVQGSILEQLYINRQKTKGVDTQDKAVNQKIYQRYLMAFQKGVYDFVREEYDPASQDIIPRKYFSGGAVEDWRNKIDVSTDMAMLEQNLAGASQVTIQLGSELTERESVVQKAVQTLQGMGKEKPLSDFPLKTYDPDMIALLQAQAGQQGLVWRLSGSLQNRRGTLYVYDRGSVQAVLEQHRAILESWGIPTEADAFVAHISTNTIIPVHAHKVIALVHGDERISSVDDRFAGEFDLTLKGSLAQIAGEFLEPSIKSRFVGEAALNLSFLIQTRMNEVSGERQEQIAALYAALFKENQLNPDVRFILNGEDVTQDLGRPLEQGDVLDIYLAADYAIAAQAQAVRVDLAMLTDYQKIVGEHKLLPTFAAFIEGIGKIAPRRPVEYVLEDAFGEYGYAPMLLSAEGQKFFQTLLGVERIPTRAQMVFYQPAEDKYRRLLKGIENLPIGIVFPDRKNSQNIYFDISKILASGIDSNLLFRRSRKVVEQENLLPLQQWNYFTLGAQSSPYILDYADPQQGKEDVHKSFDMLTVFRLPQLRIMRQELDLDYLVPDTTVFSVSDPASEDFQHAIVENRHLFPGKSVHVTGQGTGIDVLYALMFGAEKVSFYDINPAHQVLTRLNVQYAIDTGQIPGDKDVIVAAGMRKADIQLFNTPGVNTQQNVSEKARRSLQRGEGFASKSTDIYAKQFIVLLDQLSRRLRADQEAIAIWRLLIDKSTGLLPQRQGDYPGRVQEFLKTRGLTAQVMKDLPSITTGSARDNIFVLQADPAAVEEKGADQAMLVQANNQDLGGIDLNPANTRIQQQGQGDKILFPLDRLEQPLEAIDGLVPIIIQIAPVTNIPLLLGEKQGGQQERLSQL